MDLGQRVASLARPNDCVGGKVGAPFQGPAPERIYIGPQKIDIRFLTGKTCVARGDIFVGTMLSI